VKSEGDGNLCVGLNNETHVSVWLGLTEENVLGVLLLDLSESAEAWR
jgi:hypothetical protein